MFVNFNTSMPPVQSMHDIETKLIPKLIDRIKSSGFRGDFKASVEVVGESINVILLIGNQYVQEFAILSDNNGLYWTPVVRVG